jgi:hypothetical protein
MSSPLCFMCKEKRAKPLSASKGGRVYINAQNVILFCSVRCAANYGLLWGAPEVENNWHFCPVSQKWEAVEMTDCLDCKGGKS